MPYTTGTASSQQDLLSQLFTFLTSNGWTQDEFNTTDDRATIHRDDIYVSFRWNGNEGGGNPDNIAIYHSLGFTNTNDAWNHPDDSGNGTTSTNLNSQRRINGIGNGPFTSFHVFADSSPSPYFYLVLEYSPGRYRHVHVGMLDKVGTWTGGEFVAGHYWDQGSSSVDNPTSAAHTTSLDGAFSTGTNEQSAATVHAEGLPNQDASSKWLISGNFTQSVIDPDRAGNDRYVCRGGVRAGPLVSMYAVIASSNLQGFVPLCPMAVFYEDQVPNPDDFFYLIGYMPNIRQLQLTNFNPGEEITIGSDTWMLFPAVRKRFERDNEEESWDFGLAYLKTA